MKLNAFKLGIAGGLIWSIMIFCMTWIAMYTGYGMFWLSQWMDLYPGYNLTGVGSFIGLVLGFIDGFVGLFLLGWVYNLLKP